MLRKSILIIISLLLLCLTAFAEKPLEEWSIQVGVYKDYNMAEKFQQIIDPLGYETYYIEDEPGVYKVRFGEFSTKENAEKEAKKLVKKGVLKDFLIVESLWILVEPEIEYAPGDPAAKWEDNNDSGVEKFTVEKIPDPLTPPVSAEKPKPKTQEKQNVSKAQYLREKIVSTAKKYIGIPYKWGGTSPQTGFDCSGFTSTTYKNNGFTIPRRSAHQYKIGKNIKRDELKKGDLVFFATGRGWNITHVGIYVGDSKFIHAPRSGRTISIESLENSYYKKRYYGARRLVM